MESVQNMLLMEVHKRVALSLLFFSFLRSVVTPLIIFYICGENCLKKYTNGWHSLFFYDLLLRL